MKNTNLKLALLTLIIVAICFASMFVFTLPAFISQMNLTDKSNIGSAIGGITAPIIGIFSSILLFLALIRQTESNKTQREKNDVDMLFLLINQLENEIQQFYSKESNKNGERRLFGMEAIDDFTNKLVFNKDFGFGIAFNKHYEANQFMLIISSFRSIESRIGSSSLCDVTKSMFIHKLNIIYLYRLKEPLEFILAAVEKKPYLKDHLIEQVDAFVKSKVMVS